MRIRSFVLASLVLAPLFAQTIVGYRWAQPLRMPGAADSNSPAVWWNGRMVVFNSDGVARRSEGEDLFRLQGPAELVQWDGPTRSRWIEAAWVDADQTMYAWYHSEPGGVCPGDKLTSPLIGAGVSHDGGRSFVDLGIVMEGADAPNCGALNGFFSGGHGDFSVILDRSQSYFYFYFGNYGGPAQEQGIAVARMAFADREAPVDHVWKYHNGEWNEPGLKGRVTPVFPVARPWDLEDTSAFWGPSIHFNTYLNAYVILMNHACCRPRWPQEGIYMTVNADVSDPAGWSTPEVIFGSDLDHFDWYPSIVGMGPGETDTLAGDTMRFFIRGYSALELVFWDGNLGLNASTNAARRVVDVRKFTRRQ